MSKILTIVGARPQFVKAAVVSKAFDKSSILNEVVVHTGQHFDNNMSNIFFEELGMREPEYNLGVSGGTHGIMTGNMMVALDPIILKEKPQWVLVYGDTNSTVAASLSASKLHVPVAHVEAGLRSFNRKMPEELNRIVSDHLSELLFAPTKKAVQNLFGEGISVDKVHCVGDVMYDAALTYGAIARGSSTILQRLGLKSKEYVLATIHRAENTDDPERFNNLLTVMELIAKEVPIVWPMHPRTISLVKETPKGVTIINPLGYLDMMMMEQSAKLIVTDSGGVQKEAYFHSVPCVTVRTETEWKELVDLGWNRLAPPDNVESLRKEIFRTLSASLPEAGGEPYGDGTAGEKIRRVLESNS